MNLAFKCTWNDAGFSGICTQRAYEYNISKCEMGDVDSYGALMLTGDRYI